jgi:hypothetical protein
MRRSSRQYRPLATIQEPAEVFTDDGGSGLLEACKSRFGSGDYDIECDSRHTVWVRRTDGSRSIGLPPWLLRQRTMVEVLEKVETKLAMPVGER